MHPFYIIADIEHDTGEEVKYKRETDGQKGWVDEKQPDLVDRYIEALAQIGANTKGISFKKGEDPL